MPNRSPAEFHRSEDREEEGRNLTAEMRKTAEILEEREVRERSEGEYGRDKAQNSQKRPGQSETTTLTGEGPESFHKFQKVKVCP